MVIPSLTVTPIPLIPLHHLADDVRQSRKLPVVAFWALAPECLVHADGEVEVVSGMEACPLGIQCRALPSISARIASKTPRSSRGPWSLRRTRSATGVCLRGCAV